jgi:hypothetical protein
MRGQHRADESGNRVLRLADREIDRRLAGRDVGNQLGQPHEGRAAIDRRSGVRRRLALGGHHGHGCTRADGKPAPGFVIIESPRLRPR